MTARTIIKNGTIVDGTGRPSYPGDLVVCEDRIECIVPCAVTGIHASSDDACVDAAGKIVCPGFVDIHSHADLYVHKCDHPTVFEPLIRQGITSFLGGNCGYGMAPLGRGESFSYQKQYLDAVTGQDVDADPKWRTMDGFLSHLEGNGVALNMGVLCPHGLIRLSVVGPRQDLARDDDLTAMKKTLADALEQGAFGLSTGLQYFPGLLSDTRELVALGAVLAPYDGRFTSHIRSYTTHTIVRAFNEVAEVSRQEGVHVQISHIQCTPWMGRFQEAFVGLARLAARHPELSNRVVPEWMVSRDIGGVVRVFDRARREGLRLGMDVMPTNTGFTHLLALFPPWVLMGSREEVLARFRDRDARRAMKRDIEHGDPVWPHRGNDAWSINCFRLFGYGCARIMAVSSERNRHLEGRRLSDIAEDEGKHPLDAACDLMLEEEGRVLIFVIFDQPEDPFTERQKYPAYRHPDIAVVTDTLLIGYGKPSFLFHGCFPKFLGYFAREKRLATLETAVRKCTSVPAFAAGFKGRGILSEGAFADVVVFDDKAIGTDADFAHPEGRPMGIDHVWINGKHVVNGDHYWADARAGRVLRRG